MFDKVKSLFGKSQTNSAADSSQGASTTPSASAPDLEPRDGHNSIRNEGKAEMSETTNDGSESQPEGQPEAPSGEGLSPAMQVRDRIIAVLKTVYDPEIPVDIYELGLVYGVDVADDGEVHVTMTLTSPMCPVAETLPPEVEDKIRHVIGVTEVSLDLVWDPPWSMDMMSDAARLELNMM